MFVIYPTKKKVFKELYFLDKNIMIYIENYNKNPIAGKNDIISHLITLDSSDNKFTPILSILEGSRKGKDNIININNDIERNIYQLKLFFKYSYIDTSLQDVNQIRNFLAMKNSVEYKQIIKLYISFLEEINPLLKKVRKEERSEVRDMIIEKSKKYNISIYHPIVIAALAWVYGDNLGANILKISKKDHYNAVMDISHLSNFLFIIGLINEEQRFPNYPGIFISQYKFLTNDKMLEKYFKCFDLSTVDSKLSYDSRKISISFSQFGIENLPKKLISYYENI